MREVQQMGVQDDFQEIMNHAHFWNWLPDWGVVEEVYAKFPMSFSVLTPFAYAYLEEMIRSTTSEYGFELLNKDGTGKRRKVGMGLINLAISENSSNQCYVMLLENIKSYFRTSAPQDGGDNRNNVVHGYMHPRFWNQETFETLLHDIALLSKYAQFYVVSKHG